MHPGRWKVTLPAMHSGGPFTMKLEDQDGTLALHDILIGEVWLLSGQSNMTFPLYRASTSDRAIAWTDRPEIRLFTVSKAEALQSRTQLTGSWQQCSPQSARDFSAVAYFFGIDLANRLHVPIGLIHSSWPGSAAEEWVTARSLQRDPAFAPILQRWQAAPESAKAAAGDGLPFSLEFSDFALKKKDGGKQILSDFSQGSSENTFGGAWSYTWRDAPLTSWTLIPNGHEGFVLDGTVNCAIRTRPCFVSTLLLVVSRSICRRIRRLNFGYMAPDSIRCSFYSPQFKTKRIMLLPCSTAAMSGKQSSCHSRN